MKWWYMVMVLSHSLRHLHIEATSLYEGTKHGILHGAASVRGQLQGFGWVEGPVEGWRNLSWDYSLRTSAYICLCEKGPRCKHYIYILFFGGFIRPVGNPSFCQNKWPTFKEKHFFALISKTRPVGETHGTRDVSEFVCNAEWPMPPGSAGPHLLTFLLYHRISKGPRSIGLGWGPWGHSQPLRRIRGAMHGNSSSKFLG